ncbi:MAG: NAD(P)/FAD-dependent oxidoreductase, partial [Solirubrobacteraceae bacterium]
MFSRGRLGGGPAGRDLDADDTYDAALPRRAAPLPASAAVVVIGGGVMGTSAAFHLAEAGVGVVLIERAQLGSGSTRRAAGGVRTQFSDVLNIEIAKRSMDAFRDFGRRPGWEIALKQVGYLFVLTRESDVTAFQRSVALQNDCGLDSRIVTAEEARALCPMLAGDDILAGAFSPGDGHAAPEDVVQGYAVGTRAHGGHIEVGCEVLAINTSGTEIREVLTSHGPIRTNAVICAAGAWSRQCGAMVGVELPVSPLRRQILFTEAIGGLPEELPMTIDFETSFYFHREGPGLLMGMSAPNEKPGFSVETTDDWIPDLMEVVRRRAPRIADAGIRGGWAGLYEMTPDH